MPQSLPPDEPRVSGRTLILLFLGLVVVVVMILLIVLALSGWLPFTSGP